MALNAQPRGTPDVELVVGPDGSVTVTGMPHGTERLTA